MEKEIPEKEIPEKEIVEKELVEKELPVPNNKPDTITIKKSKRSAKQLEWSRELGRRSQEFKNKKLNRTQLTSRDGSSHGNSSHEIVTPPNNSKETETSKSDYSKSDYFYYLIPIGIIAGVYYFIKFKRPDNILSVLHQEVPTNPDRVTPMKLSPERSVPVTPTNSVPERSTKPNSLKLME